ncbi:MAG: STAS/SEC14 domain-containing protein [Burkholderiaceae bacterium]
MIEAELFRDEGVLVVVPASALTATDFAQLATLVDPYIAERGGLNGLMVVAGHFPGWDSFEGFIGHIRFVREHERAIARVAVVSDAMALTLLPALARHFVSAEVRHFAVEEREAAMAWLTSPPKKR